MENNLWRSPQQSHCCQSADWQSVIADLFKTSKTQLQLLFKSQPSKPNHIQYMLSFYYIKVTLSE